MRPESIVALVNPGARRRPGGSWCALALRSVAWGLALFALAGAAPAAEWQWSVPVEGPVSSETEERPRAFLWIPSNCLHVRGVVVGQHNMEEEPILEHPVFRAALAELGFAAVWVTPAFDPQFRFDQGAGDRFDAMLAALAQESGYGELVHAPVVPIGHSAMASFPWSFAALAPGRTLAAISVSGQWPYYADANSPDWGGRTVDGVPGLVTMGEYEWAEERAAEGLRQRAAHPRTPLTMLAEPARGHFDVSEAKVAYLASYVRRAAAHRLPRDDGRPYAAAPVLRPLDPTREGWLAPRWRLHQADRVPAAPVSGYTGDPAEAFWFLDAESAAATERLYAAAVAGGREPQLVGYVQDGALVPQVAGTHQQVTIPFRPRDDALTFQLTGAFLDAVPAGRPERWAARPAGAAIGHATGGGPVVIERICGPVVQLAPDTFAVRFSRMGVNNRKRTGEIWLAATHPGDAHFKPAVQQAVLRFPWRNTAGAPQRLDFPPLPDVPRGTTPVALAATADSGLPVNFYVLAGPAAIDADGRTLRLTPLPPRARRPAKVTVVAWQWGRATEPRVQTASAVERTFFVGTAGPASVSP